MKPMVLPLPGNEVLASTLSQLWDAEIGQLIVRHFPDGESYVRIDSPVSGRSIILAATLDRPESKVLPLIFTAKTLTELGATQVGLVAPYLAYMRQDKRFQAGEAVTSTHFSALLSECFDWIVTVDPHLHRHASLDELYSIPTRVVHAAPLLASWIKDHITWPVLVGPDEESEQWVSAVANACGTPYTVLHKTRHGDRDVEVTMPNIDRWRTHTPVLVDDIISTAHTMIETVHQLGHLQFSQVVCIGVHAIFADDAYQKLTTTGARIVTANTIPHHSNGIDVTQAIASAAFDLLSARAS